MYSVILKITFAINVTTYQYRFKLQTDQFVPLGQLRQCNLTVHLIWMVGPNRNIAGQDYWQIFCCFCAMSYIQK